MKGFTLIESVVVIAILSSLALVAMNNITEFQRNAILSSAAQELASTLRVAKENSTSGLVKTGESYEDTGYPYYGVQLQYNISCPCNSSVSCYTYDLTRTYTIISSSQITENIEPLPHCIDSSITVLPVPVTLTFDRVTGEPSGPPEIKMLRNGIILKTITINGSGLISL